MFIILHMVILFPQHHSLHSPLSWHPRWRSLDHVSKSLFLAVYSVPLIDISVFMPASFLSGSAVEESAFSEGDTGDAGSIHGLRRSPGEGNGNPVQYSCLRNRLDRGAWWARVQKVTKSQEDWATKHTYFAKSTLFVPIPLWYVLKSEASSFAVLSKIALPIWGALRFCVNCCMDFLYLKKIHWNFNKNCIESLNCFG